MAVSHSVRPMLTRSANMLGLRLGSVQRRPHHTSLRPSTALLHDDARHHPAIAHQARGARQGYCGFADVRLGENGARGGGRARERSFALAVDGCWVDGQEEDLDLLNRGMVMLTRQAFG